MMPTSNSHDVTDPIEQRLRHLGDHLDAERRAQTGPTAAVDPDTVPGTRALSRDPVGRASAGASDGGSRSAFRWLAVAAAVVVSVAAGAVIISNWRPTAVQSAPVTEPSTVASTATTDSTGSVPSTVPATSIATETTLASTVPVGATTVPESPGPLSSTLPSGSTAPPDSTVPAVAGDTAWAFWPDGAETQDGASSPISFGEIESIAAGPLGAVFVAKSLNAEDQVEIWTTTDGVHNEVVTSDGLVDLSGATVYATSDAYYVAPVSPSDDPVALWRSTDLRTWSQLDDSFTGELMHSASGGPTMFRRPSAERTEWSVDGVTWSESFETYGSNEDEPMRYSIRGVRFVGGEHGYVALTGPGGPYSRVGDYGWAESSDGRRWFQLPTPHVISGPAEVDGGLLMVGWDHEQCESPCAASAFRFDDRTREWTKVAAPPLRGFTELARVGDTLVASGIVVDRGRPTVAVYTSPADQIAWTPVDIRGQQTTISTEHTDETGTVHEVEPVPGPVLGVDNRVIIPVWAPVGQFVVGAVADGGVANYGLASLPACGTASGPVAQDCVYTVVPGDFPQSIANRFGTNIDQLFDANADVPVSELNMMFPGSRIIIPAPGG